MNFFQRTKRTLYAWEYEITQCLLQKPRVIQRGYEFLRFGLKQAWACLFGGLMCALLLLTYIFYPPDAWMYRYDFLTLCALLIQLFLLYFKLETWDEVKIIFIFHCVGTAMEIFKTNQGSWIYGGDAILRIANVPLFSGFMYAAVGSYIFRSWRLMELSFTHHAAPYLFGILSFCIYVNFFLHHYWYDFRYVLFVASLVLMGRSWIYFRVWHQYRRMPMIVGLLLIALFIWFAENIGTFSKAWVYPNQKNGWEAVSVAKIGSWYLLIILSYSLTLIINPVQDFKTQKKN